MLTKFSKNFLFIVLLFMSLNDFSAATSPPAGDWDPNTYDWDLSKYDFAYGDFDGVGNYDILFIAKDPGGRSGILSWDDTGHLTVLDLWDSNYLGITWHSQTYTLHIYDFNGDGRADVFMDHKNNGPNYVLLANTSGKLDTLSHTIANTHLDLDWGSSNLLFGDFNGDDKTDIYLQPKDAQTPSYVLFANDIGTFITIDDTWGNEHLELKWSQNDTLVSVTNHDQNSQDDLLLHPINSPDVEATPEVGITPETENRTDYVIIPYKKYKIPVPVKGSQEKTALATVGVGVPKEPVVIASSAGKFSEGSLVLRYVKWEIPGGRAHCQRVPQLCNSSFVIQ